jgi:hypothetical protein
MGALQGVGIGVFFVFSALLFIWALFLFSYEERGILIPSSFTPSVNIKMASCPK